MHVQTDHWILTSPNWPTKVPVRRCLSLEIYSALSDYENEKVKPPYYLVQIVDYNDLNDQWQEWIRGHPVHVVTDPVLSRAIEFFNIYHQCWALIKQGKILIYCGNTTFTYNNEFKEYMKVEGVVSEDIFDYLFDVGVGKFLSEKGKKYLFAFFEEWDPEHLKQINEYVDDYPDNDGLEDIIGDKCMQNLNNDD